MVLFWLHSAATIMLMMCLGSASDMLVKGLLSKHFSGSLSNFFLVAWHVFFFSPDGSHVVP